MKTISLTPGAVNVSARVRAGFSGADLWPHEAEFFELQDAIRGSLLDAFAVRQDYTSVLVPGGEAAMVEAMIASCVPAQGRLLVLQNGVDGDRLAQAARVHGIDCEVFQCALTERHDLELVDTRLLAGRHHTLAVVHHETTTGLLNDVASIADLCRRRNVRLLVDGIASLAGERFDFERWAPDVVACTASRCVQGLPGVSFGLVRHEYVDAMRSFPERTLSLHLPRLLSEQESRSASLAVAPPVAVALRTALDELCAETTSGRAARCGKGSSIIRRGLTNLGLELLVAEPLRSNTLSAVRLPLGVSYEHLHAALKRSGFIVAAGLGPLAASTFRVAAAGEVAEADYRRFVATVGAVVS